MSARRPPMDEGMLGAALDAPLSAESQAALGLLRRAAMLRGVATCFRDPREGLRDGVLEALSACEPSSGPLEDLARAWRDDDEETIREGHCRLFLGSAPCPPNETAWGDARRLGAQPVELADIRGFYRAFGFDLAPSLHDMPDHASVELEFLAALLVKAAYATLEGWDEQRDLTLGAARTFLEQHLGRWTGAFERKLTEIGAGSPWRETGRALDAIVLAECLALGAEPTDAAAVERLSGDANAIACPHAVAVAAPAAEGPPSAAGG